MGTIAFEKEQWDQRKADYAAWWAGELERPIININLRAREPQTPPPPVPYQHFTSHYDLSVPAEQIVDAWEHHLSHFVYPGDSFPHVFSNFGPGAAAAFLGLELVNGEATTWFQPKEEVPLPELELKPDPDNPWFQRVAALYRAGLERFGGLVQLGMTDLGGNLDILSSFRPGEKLVFDLIDAPDEVKRLTWQAHEAWWHYYEAFNEILQPENPGYTTWCPIFSPEPYYILQCDFCYMIGPDMFDEFVKPELAATCRKLVNPFYHLDGPGQLPHLDSLLEIEELKGVQWVPGAGNKLMVEWPEVYRKIRAAGKLIQIPGLRNVRGEHYLDVIADQVGSAEGIIVIGHASPEEEDDLYDTLERYGVPS